MLFSTLAVYFSQLESTASRLEKIDLLAKLLQEGKDNVQKIVYLSEGRVVPFFENLEFNVGKATIMKAISGAIGVPLTDVEERFHALGDLGDVIYAFGDGALAKPYSVTDVFNTLYQLASTAGKNSSFRKLEMLEDLLCHTDRESARYIVRIIMGKLRLGFSDRTILDALSVALTGDKSKRDVIEQAYYRCSDLGIIAQLLASKGLQGIEGITLIPSVPVFAKLVERASSVDDVFKRIPEPLFQPKYDGMRAQIHLFRTGNKREVRIFSRRLEDLTEMFPDIVQAVLSMPVESLIIDSEVIGFNPQTQEFFPFQETIQRKRKHGVDALAEKIPVVAFAFDLLYLNGEDLTGIWLSERLEKLRALLQDQDSLIKMSESVVMRDRDEAEKYFLQCVEEGLEGIIAKDLHTRYAPGTRNFEWIKLKRASVNELSDTVDTVILGYYHGYGQRSRFGIGALLVGVYNKEEDRFETIAKIGTGITDEEFQKMKHQLDENKIKEIPTNVVVDRKLVPDVIVDPTIVAVIRADEITKSPMHTAGKNGSSIGYALRFPRLVELRTDKRPEDITTVAEIREMVK